jgi:hypothetical protein
MWNLRKVLSEKSHFFKLQYAIIDVSNSKLLFLDNVMHFGVLFTALYVGK